jgi:glutamate racemase
MIENPIGVFDSGLGGLTVLKALRDALPGEDVVYLGDTLNVPYGSKTPEQICGYVDDILAFMALRPVKAVVMACNSSSAIALPRLDGRYPFPLFGLLGPASSAARAATRGGRIGLIANPVTAASGAYQAALGAGKNGIALSAMGCPDLVDIVESGLVGTDRSRAALGAYLSPLARDGIDTLILGCTHYPYFVPEIRQILGEGVVIIDPAIHIVDEVRKCLRGRGLLSSRSRGAVEYFVTGDPGLFSYVGGRLQSEPLDSVQRVDLKAAVRGACDCNA